MDGNSDDTYDSAGVFVTDKCGNSFIAEIGAFGYTLTPYTDAVMKTPAKCIALLPLEYNDVCDVAVRQQLYHHAHALTEAPNGPIELVEVIKYAVNRLMQSKSQSPSWMLLCDMYSAIGINLNVSAAQCSNAPATLDMLKNQMSCVALICEDDRIEPQFGNSTMLKRQQ